MLAFGCCDCRKDRDLHGVAPSLSHPMSCGLGITFREDSEGKLHVHNLLEGGAGEISGSVRPGDVLAEIDGVDVTHLRPEHLSALCQGVEGSKVICGFLRPPNMSMFKVQPLDPDPGAHH